MNPSQLPLLSLPNLKVRGFSEVFCELVPLVGVVLGIAANDQFVM
ncbi:hypothetical protein [Parathermosynechococcus lividus]